MKIKIRSFIKSPQKMAILFCVILIILFYATSIFSPIVVKDLLLRKTCITHNLPDFDRVYLHYLQKFYSQPEDWISEITDNTTSYDNKYLTYDSGIIILNSGYSVISLKNIEKEKGNIFRIANSKKDSSFMIIKNDKDFSIFVVNSDTHSNFFMDFFSHGAGVSLVGIFILYLMYRLNPKCNSYIFKFIGNCLGFYLIIKGLFFNPYVLAVIYNSIF